MLVPLAFWSRTIWVSQIIIWWLIFEKKPYQFWREIWIWVVVILLQLYKNAEIESIIQLKSIFFVKIYLKDHRNYEIHGKYVYNEKCLQIPQKSFTNIWQWFSYWVDVRNSIACRKKIKRALFLPCLKKGYIWFNFLYIF